MRIVPPKRPWSRSWLKCDASSAERVAEFTLGFLQGQGYLQEYAEFYDGLPPDAYEVAMKAESRKQRWFPVRVCCFGGDRVFPSGSWRAVLEDESGKLHFTEVVNGEVLISEFDFVEGMLAGNRGCFGVTRVDGGSRLMVGK